MRLTVSTEIPTSQFKLRSEVLSCLVLQNPVNTATRLIHTTEQVLDPKALQWKPGTSPSLQEALERGPREYRPKSVVHDPHMHKIREERPFTRIVRVKCIQDVRDMNAGEEDERA
ncbi:hypothetical protein EW146_g274 [Bondarzewia mesenterica]|uniref:Uncharacterized protein n=1 Tax=Bondarzewia mesenterica TaxID=1095465 RepID=A0A4S4M7U8_9AGAM|nr:hypothetical protein EW146_g274 [Bondarzewia mesenterica]